MRSPRIRISLIFCTRHAPVLVLKFRLRPQKEKATVRCPVAVPRWSANKGRAGTKQKAQCFPQNAKLGLGPARTRVTMALDCPNGYWGNHLKFTVNPLNGRGAVLRRQEEQGGGR